MCVVPYLAECRRTTALGHAARKSIRGLPRPLCALALVQSQTYANTAAGIRGADAPWKSFGAVCKDRTVRSGKLSA